MKIIRASRLIDGLGNAPVAGATVVVEGDRIREVISGHMVEPGPGDEVFDFPAGAVLPGLIDAHVHLTIDPACYDTPAYLASTADASLVEIGLRQAAQYLQAGITTVRDLGARNRTGFDVRDRVAARPGSGCRVLAAGPVITTVKGHGHFNGVEAADDAGLKQIVSGLAEQGADVIKLIATGGGVTPGSDPLRPQFSAASLRLAVEIAHAAGLRVAAHAHSAAGIRNCLDAGIDTIEHCTFVTPDGVRPDAELIDRLASSPVHVVPTLGPWYVLRDSDDPFLGFPQFGLSPRRMSDQVLSLLSQMRSAGVRLVTGTDAGTWRLTPDKLHEEIEGFTQAGFSGVEAVQAATGRAAEALGILGRTGSLSAGKLADLIVAPGDPSQDIGALARPVLVMQNGQVLQ